MESRKSMELRGQAQKIRRPRSEDENSKNSAGNGSQWDRRRRIKKYENAVYVCTNSPR